MYYRSVTESAAHGVAATAPASVPIGHPSVRAARVAAGVCVVTTGAFTLFALVTTQLKSVRAGGRTTRTTSWCRSPSCSCRY
jgi:hypothetical protein